MRTATCLGLALLLATAVVGAPAPGAQPASAQAATATSLSAAPNALAAMGAAAPLRPLVPEPLRSAQAGPPRPPRADEDEAPADETADDVRVREDDDDEDDDDDRERGVDRNVVVVINDDDGRLRVRGRVKLVRDRDTRVEAVNGALAFSSCTDCQTFAVALEIVLASPNATYIAPQNEARAINYECTRCVTVARAIQYVYTVEDPSLVPDNLRRLMHDMEKELKDIARDKSIGAAEANNRIKVVVDSFRELGDSLNDRLDEATVTTSPGASPAGPTEMAPAPAPSPVASPEPAGA